MMKFKYCLSALIIILFSSCENNELPSSTLEEDSFISNETISESFDVSTSEEEMDVMDLLSDFD